MKIHISYIKAGDTIVCNDGKIRTVTNVDIHRDTFMGISIFGDTWNLGYKLVEKK